MAVPGMVHGFSRIARKATAFLALASGIHPSPVEAEIQKRGLVGVTILNAAAARVPSDALVGKVRREFVSVGGFDAVAHARHHGDFSVDHGKLLNAMVQIVVCDVLGDAILARLAHEQGVGGGKAATHGELVGLRDLDQFEVVLSCLVFVPSQPCQARYCQGNKQDNHGGAKGLVQGAGVGLGHHNPMLHYYYFDL